MMDEITIKGQNKVSDVLQILKEELKKCNSLVYRGKEDPSYHPDRIRDQVVEVTLHYIYKNISYKEFKYTLLHWHFGENLEFVTYMNFLKSRLSKWRRWAKSNHIWWDTYRRIISIEKGKKTLMDEPGPDMFF